MRSTITIISLSVVLTGVTPTAQESLRPAGRGLTERFKQLDRNGDGKIDDSERTALREFMRQRWQQEGSMTPSGKTDIVGNREVTEMEYASSYGRKIPCVLSMPKGDGPFPCVVTIHGGQGNRDLAYIRTCAAPNPISPTVNTLNEQPWAILAISYRSGEGVMSDGEQADVVAGIRFAKTLPKIDAARVGVLGGSHGGHLALRAAELMGKEFLCVAVGSPWMTDPFVYIMGKADEPPLSQIPAAARDTLTENGERLLRGLRARMSEEEVRTHLSKNSIEAHAEKIIIPSLFMTSLSDEQVPHLLVKPTFDKLKAAGRDVTVFTVEQSPHGFYWGRSVGGSRIGRGAKSETELAEEKATREQIVAFFTKQFERTDVKAAASTKVSSGPKPETKTENKTDSRIKPTASQSAAIRKLREKMSNMPVPENLTRRTIMIGDKDREFFINIPASVKGKPAPVVFALHGGASSSGLAQHVKVDYTKLGELEGYVTVYPSGVNGWNIGSHDAYSVKRRTSDADDIGFFHAMFDLLIKEGVADTKRIYVTGGSNGGVMTQFLVCHLADRIAGVGVMVATLPAAVKNWPKPARPIPIIIMLGTADPMKPWGGNTDQLSADSTVEYWRKQNACSADGKKWELADRDPNDGCRVYAQRWEGKAPVVFYTMEGHGHGWPMQRGRDETGTGPKTRDISAPEEFWKFLKPHSLSTR